MNRISANLSNHSVSAHGTLSKNHVYCSSRQVHHVSLSTVSRICKEVTDLDASQSKSLVRTINFQSRTLVSTVSTFRRTRVMKLSTPSCYGLLRRLSGSDKSRESTGRWDMVVFGLFPWFCLCISFSVFSFPFPSFFHPSEWEPNRGSRRKEKGLLYRMPCLFFLSFWLFYTDAAEDETWNTFIVFCFVLSFFYSWCDVVCHHQQSTVGTNRSSVTPMFSFVICFCSLGEN
jgi:hypothetical protein